MSRQNADSDRYEVRLWGPVYWIAFLTPVIGLVLASLLSGAWHMAFVCVALAAMWALPLGITKRTVADERGLVSHGSPWPWSVRRRPWDQVAELTMTSTELWMVPVDGRSPRALPGCRWSTPPRHTRARQLARARDGLLRLRPPPGDASLPAVGEVPGPT